jgi:uronate dehydrogenase
MDRRRLSIWISPRDFLQLVRIGLEHPDLHFEIVYGASENDRTWWDNANAYRLGYRPEDESEPFAAEVIAAEPPEVTDPIAETFQGGPFCSPEFSGDPDRIE